MSQKGAGHQAKQRGAARGALPAVAAPRCRVRPQSEAFLTSPLCKSESGWLFSQAVSMKH